MFKNFRLGYQKIQTELQLAQRLRDADKRKYRTRRSTPLFGQESQTEAVSAEEIREYRKVRRQLMGSEFSILQDLGRLFAYATHFCSKKDQKRFWGLVDEQIINERLESVTENVIAELRSRGIRVT